MLARVRYREKSPAPKVTGRGQGSGWGRASHGEVDDISERKVELLLMQHTVLTSKIIMADYVHHMHYGQKKIKRDFTIPWTHLK